MFPNRSRLRAKALLAAALLATFFSGHVRAAFAQDYKTVAGQWQGTTDDAKPNRVILQIETDTGTSATGLVYLLDSDNAAWRHATSSFTLRGSDIAFRIANIEANFEGKLNEDRTSISGTWKQHGVSSPLRLVHVTGDAAWEIPASGKSMGASADPSFEIATVKPAEPNDNSSGFQLMGERLRARNESLEDIVSFAYGIHRKQILNAPAWFGSERWQIDGLADTPGEPNLKQMRSMYRKLLADRFALKLTPEKREIPAYVIEAGKEGTKLTRSRMEGGLPDSTGNWNHGVHEVRYTNMTMDEFANDLSFTEDRPMVNHTGLSGRYDFRLRWSSLDTPVTEGSDSAPSLFTAMQEQLGLKVQATRTTADVYVVAHVERPSPN